MFPQTRRATSRKRVRTKEEAIALYEKRARKGYLASGNTFWAHMHTRRKIVLTEVLLDIGFDDDKSILDVGSGLSLMAEISRDIGANCRITAFDLSSSTVERGRKKHPDVDFTVDDAQDPKIKGKWDIVFAGEIIEHLPDPGGAFANWARKVKKGGHLVVTTPNASHNLDTEEHISLHTPGAMATLFEENGFELLGIRGMDLAFPLPGIGPFMKVGFVKFMNLLLGVSSEKGSGFVDRYISCVDDNHGLACDVIYWGRLQE